MSLDNELIWGSLGRVDADCWTRDSDFIVRMTSSLQRWLIQAVVSGVNVLHWILRSLRIRTVC